MLSNDLISLLSMCTVEYKDMLHKIVDFKIYLGSD